MQVALESRDALAARLPESASSAALAGLAAAAVAAAAGAAAAGPAPAGPPGPEPPEEYDLAMSQMHRDMAAMYKARCAAAGRLRLPLFVQAIGGTHVSMFVSYHACRDHLTCSRGGL
jgi:hypothetical protein